MNTETVVYKVTLPATPGAGARLVNLTSFVNTSPGLKDGGEPAVKFYALAFAPAGAIGVATLPTGETLVGGDSKGEIRVIQANGTPLDVGNFGEDPDMPTTNTLALSGDLVFYDDATGTATGLATIRSCTTSDLTKCIKTSDDLAAINMANLKANATTPTSPGLAPRGHLRRHRDDGRAGHDRRPSSSGSGPGRGGLRVRALLRVLRRRREHAGIHRQDQHVGGGRRRGRRRGADRGQLPVRQRLVGAGVTTKVTVTVIAPPPTAPPPMAH